jgi:hypothetical protein
VRDDFSQRTVRKLAARAGYHCTNPDCQSLTLGPAVDEDGTVHVGFAAHIAAASPGGKRYDCKMTPEERSAAANGIYLCGRCAKLIDSDEKRYPATLLHRWKEDAVKRTIEAVASGLPLGNLRPSPELDDADKQFLSGLKLPSEDAVEAVRGRLRTAAHADVGAFRAQRGWPARTVVLSLRLKGKPVADLTLESVARLTELAEPVLVTADGGTGKSTTVVQLAERMLADDGPVPLLVPLGHWCVRQDDFFDCILRRGSFGALRRQHLMQLAYHGKIVLILDGWNELTPDARRRATSDLGELSRDYPQLGMVISTRRQALPVDGPVIEIGGLSREQQKELAVAARGVDDGPLLLERARRTAGVRELVGIPLYLSALLALPDGSSPFPETKEEVLRLFVERNEAPPDRREAIEQATVGQHKLMLVAIAVGATKASNTTISASDANRCVSHAVQLLIEDGQITVPPQPSEIINGFVGAHLLKRSGDELEFQHQLFQEWYASYEVESLMRKASADGVSAKKRLREDVLNWLRWEESILFACERASRADEDGVAAVANAVGYALGIDPILAAMMLNRSSDAVWERVRECVMAFVDRWHTPGSVDRAARFMVTSGKAEFAPLIWPLASSEDDQIQFGIFRSADRFQPSVLGPDAEVRLRELPVAQRKLALSEIAGRSGFDGMELAADATIGDPDPSVVVGVVQSFDFRGADLHVTRIMRHPSDEAWNSLAVENYPERFADPDLDARFFAARAAALAAAEPHVLLSRLAREKPLDAEARVSALVASPQLEVGNGDVVHAISHAHTAYPAAVAEGLVVRVAADLPLPFDAGRYLEHAALADDGPVATAALNPGTPQLRLNAAAAVIGPKTVSALLDQLVAIDDRLAAGGHYDQTAGAARQRLIGAITSSREGVFVPVLLARGQTEDPRQIGLMADLLARHGDSDVEARPPIDEAHRAPLRAVVGGWIEALLRSPVPVRYFSAEVARAAGRLADPALAEPLSRLLERDLRDLSAERDARRAKPRGASAGSGSALMIYTSSYTRAFAAMRSEQALKRYLPDLQLGTEAAGALYEIWSRDQSPNRRHRLGGSGDFSHHMPMRAERSKGTPASSDSAEAIFAVVRWLGKAEKTREEQRHAIALAVPGLGMPHGSKRNDIDMLLALPQPIEVKQRLLRAAAMVGEIIPAALLIEGLRSVLDAAASEPWRLDPNRGELMSWIDLFPFSDEPAKVHDALASLPDQHRHPHALHRLLDVLPSGPPESAVARLQQLASDDPRFNRDTSWVNALLRLDTESAALSVLEMLFSDKIPLVSAFRWSQALVAWASSHPAFRKALIARYGAGYSGVARPAVQMALAELGDEEALWVLFEGQVTGGDEPSVGDIWDMVRKSAFEDRPSTIEGWFEEIGRPLTNLRARLFAMLPGDDKKARLAKRYLMAIDGHRDEGGRVYDEPRHPDIATGRPWPPESLANKQREKNTATTMATFRVTRDCGLG